MRKALTVLALASLLGGCAAGGTLITETGSSQYRPRGEDNPWSIEIQRNSVTGAGKILVNGEVAAEGQFSMWDGSGTILGEHDGRQVRGECERTECMVFVDGELAGRY